MNPILQKLNDIEGIDKVSIWPLAMGSWIILILCILLLALICGILYKRRTFRRSWKRAVLQQLAIWESNLSDENACEVTESLSSYLRRLAMQRFSRRECAGLVGDEWLCWLKEHDPKQFDWAGRGKLLTHFPYAPKRAISAKEIRVLIQAVKKWVH